MPMSCELPPSADAVVTGGGTVGAWCAYFLRRAGLETVVVVEKGHLGQGASSRAAGVVRIQGGTAEAVRLGAWSREFYLRQRAEIGTDSGFVQQGYLLPCFTPAEVALAQARIAMQRAACWRRASADRDRPVGDVDVVEEAAVDAQLLVADLDPVPDAPARAKAGEPRHLGHHAARLG